jgi:hypothetical protein
MRGSRGEGVVVGGYADKLQQKVGGVLGPGEAFAAAVRTMPRGTTMGTAVGGLIGEAVAGRQASKAQAAAGEGSLAASWPTGNAAVGLTGQRILVFNYTAMGKPKDLVGEFPLDQVQAVELEKKKMTANALHVQFVDGSAVQLECAKMEKTADFVEAFRRVKAEA